MAKEFIGVIVGANSGQIYAVINPDDDSELGNPRLLLIQSGPPRFRLVDASRYTLPNGAEPVMFYEIEPDTPATREPMRMVRIPRGEYQRALTLSDVAALIARLAV
jgi:hypothetical protein